MRAKHGVGMGWGADSSNWLQMPQLLGQFLSGKDGCESPRRLQVILETSRPTKLVLKCLRLSQTPFHAVRTCTDSLTNLYRLPQTWMPMNPLTPYIHVDSDCMQMTFIVLHSPTFPILALVSCHFHCFFSLCLSLSLCLE